MRRLLRLSPFVLLLWPLWANAGPPFLTDDPDPIDYRTFEAIPNYNLDRAADGNTVAGPGLDFNYGIHPDMHLNLGPGLVREEPAQGTSAYGFSDTRVALKWRFVHESEDMPEIAIYPAVELPTGSARRGLGNGQVWYQFPVWLEKNWGPWSSYGGGGWTLNRAPGQRDYFYGGWQAQRNFDSGSFLGGEIYSQGTSADGVGGYTALNLGGGYAFDKHAVLIFSGGHTFAGASHLFLYLGVDFTWGP
jgi:hypothetical protein